jgi:hypothetical protein
MTSTLISQNKRQQLIKAESEKPGKGSYIINELGVGYRMNDELTDIS